MTIKNVSWCIALFGLNGEVSIFASEPPIPMLSVPSISERLLTLYDAKQALPDGAEFDPKKQSEIDVLNAQLITAHNQNLEGMKNKDCAELAFCQQQKLELQDSVKRLRWLSAGTGLVAAAFITREILLRHPRALEKISELCQ